MKKTEAQTPDQAADDELRQLASFNPTVQIWVTEAIAWKTSNPTRAASTLKGLEDTAAKWEVRDPVEGARWREVTDKLRAFLKA